MHNKSNFFVDMRMDFLKDVQNALKVEEVRLFNSIESLLPAYALPVPVGRASYSTTTALCHLYCPAKPES
ncbi:hypothetical protein T10_11683 [Trichinella papuae]|uniref:Uncharacterized protein n=1 Tax=Trichinella papuae TaxID=268474 RepID=A0A0V1M2Q6_9BILA|nr:hypothetical protein T10_11683 [Trichinella papuae]